LQLSQAQSLQAGAQHEGVLQQPVAHPQPCENWELSAWLACAPYDETFALYETY
jgi:hypothetical protein